MIAAAYTLPVDRACGWLEELDRIVKRVDGMSSTVGIAFPSVVEATLHDLEITEREKAHLTLLLSQRKPRRRRDGMTLANIGDGTS
jgi:hypothetical protein